MSFKTIRLKFIVLILGILLMAALRLPYHTAAKESLASQLMAIAQESIQAQYQTLVSGRVEAALEGKRFAHLYREAIRDQLSSQVAMRNRLMSTKQDFKGFRTRLLLQEISVKDNKAQLKAIEISEFDMSPPGGPTLAQSSDPHLFEFVNENGQWRLVNDSIVRPEPLRFQEGVVPPESSFPLVPLTTDRPKQSRLRRTNGAKAHFIRASFAQPVPTSYNRYAAIEYAKAHALNHNPIFKDFNRTDCTNFVSQTLLAGGWPMVTGFYRNSNVWWYACTLPGGYLCSASWTWGAAFNFREFMLGSNRVNAVGDWHEVNQGDLIFADWTNLNGSNTPDGRVDHVMFVTGSDTEGNLYISQHTTDRRDWPMTATIQMMPLGVFVGYRVKDSF